MQISMHKKSNLQSRAGQKLHGFFSHNQSVATWRRFSHKAYAAFQSLHREVRIGVLGVAMLSACTFVSKPVSTRQILQTGDLLFCLETQDDGLGGAIAAVTEGVGQQQISHVAIAVNDRQVVEATPRWGVRIITVSQFLAEAHHAADGSPLVVVGRLKDTTGVVASVDRALQYVGLPYDTLYLPDESAIYCSELVQLSYRRQDNTPVFEQQPMSFSDSSGQILPYWIDLYAAHGMQVPEGLPGTNPGALSRDTSIYIINL